MIQLQIEQLLFPDRTGTVLTTNNTHPTKSLEHCVAATIDSFTMASTASTSTLVLANGEGGFDSSANTYTLDSYASIAETDRVLIKNGVNSNGAGVSHKWNGTYTVGSLSGSSLTLTRATDYNHTDEMNEGDYVFIKNGTNNANLGYAMTQASSITVGTTAILWNHFHHKQTFLETVTSSRTVYIPQGYNQVDITAHGAGGGGGGGSSASGMYAGAGGGGGGSGYIVKESHFPLINQSFRNFVVTISTGGTGGTGGTSGAGNNGVVSSGTTTVTLNTFTIINCTAGYNGAPGTGADEYNQGGAGGAGSSSGAGGIAGLGGGVEVEVEILLDLVELVDLLVILTLDTVLDLVLQVVPLQDQEEQEVVVH